MNETIINNWNLIVKPNDTIYHLGDVMFRCKNKTVAEEFLNKLNGNIKYLIIGNHDQKEVTTAKNWQWARYSLQEMKLDNQLIILSHYAMRVWRNSCHGSWCFSAHSHNGMNATRYNEISGGLILDVGVDSAAYYYGNGELKKENYKPFSYEDIKKIMAEKQKAITAAGFCQP
jgi:calcineurin-like phosphoesterase family protein